MLQITELLTPTPQPLWRLVRQAGVEEVVTLLDGAEQMWRWPHGAGSQDWTPASYPLPAPGERPWELPALRPRLPGPPHRLPAADLPDHKRDPEHRQGDGQGPRGHR